jgi:MFS family permease
MNNAESPSQTPGGQPPAAGRGSYAILHNRDFLLFLIGRFIMVIGFQMFAMAIGWELYERTQSALALGLVGLTQIAPMFLFTLPAGHVADNYDRKRVVAAAAAIMAASYLALTFISATAAPVPWVYLCLFITGAARTFLAAAVQSFLPQLVDRKEFSRAVTWNSGTFQLSSILGPAAGGALIGLFHHRAAPVYALSALAAVVFCILISLIRKPHRAVTPEEMSFKTLLTGFSFVFANRIILGVITLDMFAVLLGGATALLPVYAKEILFVGPRGLGLLQAALPLGAVACAFVLAHRRPLQKAGPSMLWAIAAFGLATITFGFSRWFWFSFAMLFVCGAVDNISVVVRHTLVQMLTPDEKRGRVSAVNNLFIGTSNELGEFESGFVAQLCGPMIGNSIALGAMISVVSGGVGTLLVVATVAWLWPEIRRYGRLDA